MSSASIVNNIAVSFNRITPIPIFFLGLMGNIFNILIFLRPLVIKNPCSTYFLCVSIANINVLIFSLVVRYLADGFGIDLVSYNLAFCRIRYFIIHCATVLSSWYVILAGIDRYCISSRDAHRRQLSNLKYARYLVASTTFVGLALYSQVFGMFTIEQLQTGPYCYAQDGAYRIFYDFFYFATFSFTPPIIMVIVGLGTFYNIHQTNVQVNPVTTNTTNVFQLRRRDRQLIRMLLVQCICTVILTMPVAVQKLYVTFTENVTKDAYRLAIESFIVQITRVLVYINCSTSFYMFTLSGSLHRKEFLQIINQFIGFIFGKNSSIYRKFQQSSFQTSNVQSIRMNRAINSLE